MKAGISRFLKLGWHVVTEAHTALWVIGELMPSIAIAGLVYWVGEHSYFLLAIAFILAFVAFSLVTLAILGYRREAQTPKSRGGDLVDGPKEWTIGELFFHICPDLERDKENVSLRRDTARAVLDALASGKIKMRGRMIAGARQLPLSWVEPTYSTEVLFTYWFFDRDESVLDVRHEKTGVEYADLCVPRADAIKVWPLPIPLREAARLAYEGT